MLRKKCIMFNALGLKSRIIFLASKKTESLNISTSKWKFRWIIDMGPHLLNVCVCVCVAGRGGGGGFLELNICFFRLLFQIKKPNHDETFTYLLKYTSSKVICYYWKAISGSFHLNKSNLAEVHSEPNDLRWSFFENSQRLKALFAKSYILRCLTRF